MKALRLRLIVMLLLIGPAAIGLLLHAAIRSNNWLAGGMTGFLFVLWAFNLPRLWATFTTEPKAGERWLFKHKRRDPWDERAFDVTIHEVREGWVRYSMGSGSIFDDERMELENFLYCYRRPKATGSAA